MSAMFNSWGFLLSLIGIELDDGRPWYKQVISGIFKSFMVVLVLATVLPIIGWIIILIYHIGGLKFLMFLGIGVIAILVIIESLHWLGILYDWAVK